MARRSSARRKSSKKVGRPKRSNAVGGKSKKSKDLVHTDKPKNSINLALKKVTESLSEPKYDFIIRDNSNIAPRPFLSKGEQKKQKETILSNLEPGDRFIIPALEDYDLYRNLWIYSISRGSSVVIRGEMRIDKGETAEENGDKKNVWKQIPRNYCIAPTTIVKRV